MSDYTQLAEALSRSWSLIHDRRALVVLPDGPVTGPAFLAAVGRLRAVLARSVPAEATSEPLAVTETSSSVATLLLAHAALAEGWAFSVYSPDWPRAYREHARACATPTLELTEADILAKLTDPPGDGGPDLAEPRLVPDVALSHLLFTSGSTGTPAAIATERRSLGHHLAVLHDEFQPDRTDVVLQLAPPHLDASLRDLLFPSLVPCQIVPGTRRNARIDIIAVAGQIISHRVTRILSVLPSVLFEIATQLSERGVQAPEVQCIAVSGEMLTRRTVSAARRAFPAAVVVNQYGPSETTMTATRITMGPDSVDDSNGARVGTPYRGYHVRVADPAGLSLPAFTSGTVRIGGVGVARGYTGDPRSTAAAFLPNPMMPGAREFDTGDVGARQSDGSLMLQGRADDQVKVLGHKFMVSAIASALETLPSVSRAAALAVSSPQRIYAFVVGHGDGETSADLQRALAEVLPYWMLPTSIFVIPRLPVLGNGKLDRGALLRLTISNPAILPPAPGSTSDELTEAIRHIWSRQLHRHDFADTDDFFVMGGNSLLALKVISECKVLVPELTVKQFFRAPTIESICSLRAGNQ